MRPGWWVKPYKKTGDKDWGTLSPTPGSTLESHISCSQTSQCCTACSFTTTEFHLQILPATPSSTNSLHLAHSKVSFLSAPRCQSKLTILYNHKCWLLCPAGSAVRRFKATDRREAAGAHSPICFNVAASASLRAVTSEDRRPSPPFQLVIPSVEDKTSSVALATRLSTCWAKP